MKVLKIKENKDESADIVFEITKGEKDLIKKYYNRKRFTAKLFQKVMLEAIDNTIRKYLKRGKNQCVKEGQKIKITKGNF